MERIRYIRKWILLNQNTVFMCFFIPIVLLMSFGLGSVDTIYKYVFSVCLVFWVIKLLGSDFLLREWVMVFIIFTLLMVNAWHNGERKLILTAMVIVALKGVRIETVFKVSFWVRLISVLTNMILSIVGIRPDVITGELTKYDLVTRLVKQVQVHSYGFKHPNHSILYVYSILILFLLAYGNRLLQRSHRIIAYSLCTGVMWLGYQVFEGRTAWYAWIVAIILLLVGELLTGKEALVVYLKAFSALPTLVLICSGIEIYLVKIKFEPAMTINYAFSGRFAYYSERLEEVAHAFCWGIDPRATMDSALFNLICNYGMISSLACIALYTVCIYRMAVLHNCFACVALASALFYALTEEMLLNASINLSLLCLGYVIWGAEQNSKVHNKEIVVENT